MRPVIFFIIILLVFLIFMITVAFVLRYYKTVPPEWPYIFYLKNIGSAEQNIKVLVNGAQYKTYKLPVNFKGQVTVGSNIVNPQTKKPFRREEVVTVAFYLDKPGNIQYQSLNVFQKPVFSGITCQGDNCGEEALSKVKTVEKNTPPIFVMDRKGYYTIRPV